MIERHEPHNRFNFIHFSVNAQGGHFIFTAEPEVAHGPTRIRKLAVIGDNGSAFKSVHEFCGVKAKDFRSTETTHHGTITTTAEGVCGVE